MARRPTGSEVLERARRDIAHAKSVEQLRTAQAVVLPLDYGLSLAETAKVVGRSAAWVARERRRYINGDTLFSVASSHGGRRRQLLSAGEELELVAEGIRRSGAHWGHTQEVIRYLIEERLGRPIANSTFNNILTRAAKQLIPGGQLGDLAMLDRTLRMRIGANKIVGRVAGGRFDIWGKKIES